jgi:hypothetical protein
MSQYPHVSKEWPERTLLRWERQGLDRHPHDSVYVDLFWTPIIGPTGMTVWRRLVSKLDMPDQTVSLPAMFEDIGVTVQRVVWNTLNRMAVHHMVYEPRATELCVADSLTVLRPHQVGRLSDRLQAMHSAFHAA